MKGKIKIDGKLVPYDFNGQLELHLDPFKYGVFDIIGKKSDGEKNEVLFQNAAVSFINPKGSDSVGLTAIITVQGEEPYVVDCATYEKICSIKNLNELKLSKPVKS